MSVLQMRKLKAREVKHSVGICYNPGVVPGSFPSAPVLSALPWLCDQGSLHRGGGIPRLGRLLVWERGGHPA